MITFLAENGNIEFLEGGHPSTFEAGVSSLQTTHFPQHRLGLPPQDPSQRDALLTEFSSKTRGFRIRYYDDLCFTVIGLSLK